MALERGRGGDEGEEVVRERWRIERGSLALCGVLSYFVFLWLAFSFFLVASFYFLFFLFIFSIFGGPVGGEEY